MSGITVVEFENAVHTDETYLSSELEDGPPYTVHGVALGNGDVTKGKSGIKKKWPAEELEKAAETLQGTNLVIDHENSVHGVIGRVTKAGYKEDTGVVYEAELYDEDLAEKIQKGLLEVSVRGLHKDVEDLERDSDSDALVVEDIEFKNLSIVPSGASPSNTLEMGEHAELSAAELASFTDTLAELQEIEPGMWVKWDDKRGITTSQVQDGEIEVDIYEEKDGQWRSTEQTEMVDTNDLDKWDVDEDNIGPAADSDEEKSSDEEENSEAELIAQGDKVQWDSAGGLARGVVVDRQESGCFEDRIDGDVKVCADEDDPALLIRVVQETDDGFEKVDTLVAHKESTVEQTDFSLSELEDEGSDEGKTVDPPKFEEGDMVQWQVAPSMKGKIVHAPANQEIVMVEVMQENDGDMTSTGFTVTAGYSDIKHLDRESGSVEENAAVDRGEFVKWRDHDSNWRHGQIIEIEQDGQQMVATLRRFTESGDKLDETARKPVQGLEKWDSSPEKETDSDGTESVSDDSGATVNDLINVLASVVENASTSKDAPTDEAEPDHEPMGSMENLFNKFMEDGGSPDSTLSDFIEWLNEQEELGHNLEGVDSKLDDPVAIRRMKENDSAYMAFVWQSDDVGNTVPAEELETRYDDYPEAASKNAQMALDAREETGNPNDCGTDVGWKRAKQLANGEGLTREQVAKMSAFNRHRQNSEMDDDEGRADCGWMMWKAWGGDEGVDWAQRKLDKIEEENMDEAELQDYEMHTPDWSGTTESEWSSPDMEDFDTDDLSEIADHFLISATGFPPENFTDLKLPVVEPNGDLNVNALAAVKGGRGVSAVEGLSDDMEEKIVEWANETANEEFDRDWGMSEEENSDNDRDEEEAAKHHHKTAAEMLNDFLEVEDNSQQTPISDFVEWADDDSVRKTVRRWTSRTSGRDLESEVGKFEECLDTVLENDDETEMAQYIEVQSGPTQSKTVGGVRVLPGDDLQDVITGESEADSLTDIQSDTMTEEIEEKLAELSNPVAVEAEELEQLQEKADQFEELSENIEAIRERTELLDEVEREKVEELRDGDDPVVVESDRYEELQSEAEQVKGVYAAQLAEHYDAFDSDELADKFSIEELRDKYEDQFGSIEELADSTEAEPQSQDPSEEELEEESGEESEAELSDEIKQKQEEIRQKLDIGGD